MTGSDSLSTWQGDSNTITWCSQTLCTQCILSLTPPKTVIKKCKQAGAEWCWVQPDCSPAVTWQVKSCDNFPSDRSRHQRISGEDALCSPAAPATKRNWQLSVPERSASLNCQKKKSVFRRRVGHNESSTVPVQCLSVVKDVYSTMRWDSVYRHKGQRQFTDSDLQ